MPHLKVSVKSFIFCFVKTLYFATHSVGPFLSLNPNCVPSGRFSIPHYAPSPCCPCDCSYFGIPSIKILEKLEFRLPLLLKEVPKLSFLPDDGVLPILRFHDQILDHVGNHRITCIQGETGCGKSTKVPQFILDDYKRYYHSSFRLLSPYSCREHKNKTHQWNELTKISNA